MCWKLPEVDMAVLLTCRENKRGMQKTPTSTNTKSHNDQQLTATLPLGGSELRSGEGYSSLMSLVDSVIYLPSPLVPRDPPGGRMSCTGSYLRSFGGSTITTRCQRQRLQTQKATATLPWEGRSSAPGRDIQVRCCLSIQQSNCPRPLVPRDPPLGALHGI